MKDSQCVLIVDDQQAELTLVAEFLKSSGYTVTLASDGFKALAACKVRTPDVILLDLQMPLMSGMDVYNRLNSDEKTKHIPIIFLRAEGQVTPPARELEDSAILVKPLDPQDVYSLVRTVLRQKSLGDELRKKESQVTELSLTDTLTSLRNSRYLAEFLKTELNQCSRYNNLLTILTIEVDNPRELIKLYTQKGVDSILAQLGSAVLTKGLRKADLLARTGPFEFVIALPFTNAEGAVEVAERARIYVEQTPFTVGEKTTNITVSIGIAQFRSEMDTEGTMLLSYARAAMGQAREAGGNQTFMAE